MSTKVKKINFLGTDRHFVHNSDTQCLAFECTVEEAEIISQAIERVSASIMRRRQGVPSPAPVPTTPRPTSKQRVAFPPQLMALVARAAAGDGTVPVSDIMDLTSQEDPVSSKG